MYIVKYKEVERRVARIEDALRLLRRYPPGGSVIRLRDGVLMATSIECINLQSLASWGGVAK